jgi:hypothetical protein
VRGHGHAAMARRRHEREWARCGTVPGRRSGPQKGERGAMKRKRVRQSIRCKCNPVHSNQSNRRLGVAKRQGSISSGKAAQSVRHQLSPPADDAQVPGIREGTQGRHRACQRTVSPISSVLLSFPWSLVASLCAMLCLNSRPNSSLFETTRQSSCGTATGR